MTLIGATGSGKTHLALVLASMREYALVIATKRRDPVLEELGWKRVRNLREDVLWTADRRVPLDPKLVYWPTPQEGTVRRRQAAQARQIREALDWADRTGGWALVIDELMYVSRSLGLERELEHAWFQSRTQGVSLIGAAQRPTQVPLLAFSQASYVVVWQTSDGRDIERLREVAAGFPRETIEECVRSLDWDAHEFLLMDTRRRELVRSIAPAEVR